MEDVLRSLGVVQTVRSDPRVAGDHREPQGEGYGDYYPEHSIPKEGSPGADPYLSPSASEHLTGSGNQGGIDYFRHSTSRPSPSPVVVFVSISRRSFNTGTKANRIGPGTR